MSSGRWIIANWGMGADSSAWLLLVVDLVGDYRAGRITHAELLQRAGLPADCDIERLVVIVAMTGTEWPETKELGEKHILPALAAARIRLVQVARAGRLQGDGVTILSDTRTPRVLHTEGDFRLIDEMRQAGTIPTTGLDRKCSIHAKGWAVDPTIPRIVGDDAYVQVMGFENSKGERGRADRDAKHNKGLREGVYPLIAIGWDRARCEKEIEARTGVIEYRKSACPACPYALQNRASLRMVLDGYSARPDIAAEVLMTEHGALALNERMGLSGGNRLYDTVEALPRLQHVLDAFHRALSAEDFAVFEVKRVSKALKKKDGTVDRSRRGFTARKVEKVVFDRWADAGPRPSRTHRDTVAAVASHACEEGRITADQVDRLLPSVEATTDLDALKKVPARLGMDAPWEETAASRETMLRRLEHLAAERGLTVDWRDEMHPRVWVRRRDDHGDLFPALEHFFVLAPAVVTDKENRAFAKAWADVEADLAELPSVQQLSIDLPDPSPVAA